MVNRLGYLPNVAVGVLEVGRSHAPGLIRRPLEEADAPRVGCGDEARQVAEARGIKVQADPQPERNVFIRSDQYNFIRHGIPALAMGVAPDPNSPEQKQLFRDWLTHRYHAPSDDLDQPVDLSSAAQYEEVIRGLMISVADSSKRPQWKAESFFRRYAENPSLY